MKMFYTSFVYVFSFVFKTQNTRKVDDTGGAGLARWKEREEGNRPIVGVLRYWARAEEL